MAYGDPAPQAAVDGVSQAVEQSQYAEMDGEQKRQIEAENNAVKAEWTEYDNACKFDKAIRSQYAIDRRYAAGTADQTWAVDTNLIGSFIDILVSFLYARDPAVSVKKAPRVDNSGSKDMDTFAKTLELVIRSLWKRGKLKKQIKKQVRSTLATGVGWLKVVMLCDAPVNPETQKELNDMRDNIAKLSALHESLSKVQNASTEQVDAELEQLREQEQALIKKIEPTILKHLAIDFVPSQNFQVSLDVATTEDYLEADWNANHTFVVKTDAKSKFPRLTDDDLKTATCYYQRNDARLDPLTDRIALSGMAGAGVDASEADQFTTGAQPSGGTGVNDSNSPPFIKVVEKWDHRTNHIKTMIEGVKRWAKDPFQPNYPCARFYPYFRLAFFEVDGSRHPQSLSWRLHKLQDEYARSRSQWRVMRERAIPATMFDASNIEQKDADKIANSTTQEMIPVKPATPGRALSDFFASKPYERIDPRMFENSPILADMEKISGVQEALQSSAKTPKTATEATIEQSGFASRTTADRDTLEDMLTDMAEYTAQVSLGALKIPDVQRIAGAAAYWPVGMSVDDLATMVEVDIEAGSTGKPNDEEDKQAWGVVLPVLKDAVIEINGAIAAGNIPMAKALSELVKLTLSVMGDTTDLSLILPEIPEMPPLGAPPAIPGAGPMVPPGAPSAPLPPSASEGAGGAPPLENPTTENPTL